MTLADERVALIRTRHPDTTRCHLVSCIIGCSLRCIIEEDCLSNTVIMGVLQSKTKFPISYDEACKRSES